MSRRRSKLFDDAPKDPRARRVVNSYGGGKTIKLNLECGHMVRRRIFGEIPQFVVCSECPTRGGLGGRGIQPE